MRRIVMCGLIAASMLAGCDRRDPSPAATGPIEIASPATAPATAPAVPEPTSSFITIGDRMIQFPPAHIRIREDDESRIALLYSAKPKISDRENEGNSYYFQMILDIPDGGGIADAGWRYKAPSSEAADSPNGIFLDGAAIHLQPLDVVVEFEEQSPYLAVYITGQFLSVVDAEGDMPSDFVPVSARLIAKIDGDGK